MFFRTPQVDDVLAELRNFDSRKVVSLSCIAFRHQIEKLLASVARSNRSYVEQRSSMCALYFLTVCTETPLWFVPMYSDDPYWWFWPVARPTSLVNQRVRIVATRLAGSLRQIWLVERDPSLVGGQCWWNGIDSSASFFSISLFISTPNPYLVIAATATAMKKPVHN